MIGGVHGEGFATGGKSLTEQDFTRSGPAVSRVGCATRRTGLWHRLGAILTALTLTTIAACGGSAPPETGADPLVAAQIETLLPAEEGEQVGVFVALGGAQAAAAAISAGETVSFPVDPDGVRAALQRAFLQQLVQAVEQAGSPSAAAAVGSSGCDRGSLSDRIARAVSPRSASAVRIDLTACELR
ncbi:MAG: hypothetical protein KGR68_19390, partial [Betaproteobacteria bacterium]|nr:hypothetical protein [Betaproteobacteria bacterium]